MTISLTPDQKVLWLAVAGHDFNNSDFDKNQSILQLQRSLMESLIASNSIPKNRLLYFVDPEFNASRSKMSKQEVFEKNGTHGSKIFEHPDFFKYLAFFIEGPDLPESVAEQIELIYQETSYDDDKPVRIYDYLITRKNELSNIVNYDLAEEVYKALIDKNCPLYRSQSIRTKIKGWR